MRVPKLSPKCGAGLLAVSLFSDERMDQMRKQFRWRLSSCCHLWHSARPIDRQVQLPPMERVVQSCSPPRGSPRVSSASGGLLDRSPSEWKSALEPQGWQLACVDDGVQVYRRFQGGTSLAEYKVLGRFDDINPRQFYRVQMDLDYRKRWDPNVKELRMIGKRGDADIIVWVHQYPYPFSSRVYLYTREAYVDDRCNVMYFRAKSIRPTELDESQAAVFHRVVAKNHSSVLVEDYSSEMVVKASNTLGDAGITYMLDYFDNPKISLPSFSYDWASKSAIVDFTKRMRIASKKLPAECAND